MATKKTASKTAKKPTRKAVVIATATVTSRVDRLEAILAQFDKEPPALSDAEKIFTALTALEGRVESAHAQLRSFDKIHDAIAGLGQRLNDVSAAAGMASTVVPRDFAHETTQLHQSLKCGVCGAGTTRIVLKSNPGSNEAPCGVCNNVMRVQDSVVVHVDAAV